MGDEDRGGAEVALQAFDLGPGPDAQAGIEVGQRFVHQQHGGVADDRAADRDPLALAAGKLGRTALQQRSEIEHLGCSRDLSRDGSAIDSLLLQAERHVVLDAHMRVKRIVLKHHGDIALVRFQIGDVVAVEHDPSAARPLQPGDAGERRALAAAAWSKEGQELTIVDPDVEAIDSAHLIEVLGQSLKGYTCHDRLPIP